MITDRGEYKKTNMENVKMLILDIDGTLIAAARKRSGRGR